MSAVTSRESEFARRAIDMMLELYVAWREQCAAVRRAYRSWDHSGPGERGLAYAGYVVALDAEERAALAYARQIDLVDEICV